MVRRRRLLLGLAMICLLTHVGCQSLQLEKHTMRQAKTLTDIQYLQVLDNLAMFSVNPGSLPYFSATGTGVTNIQQAATANFTPAVDLLMNPSKMFHYYSDKFGYGVTGSQMNLEQWNSASVLNPDELKMMQCVYQGVLGFRPPPPDTCGQRLHEFFKDNPEFWDALQRKWLCVGLNGELPPRGAAYTGRYGKRHVWVMPENVGYLTKITLAILDLATALPTSASPSKLNDKEARLKALQDRLTALTGAYDKVKDLKLIASRDRLAGDISTTIDEISDVIVGAAPTVRERLPLELREKVNAAERGHALRSLNAGDMAAIKQALDTPLPVPVEPPTTGSPFTRERKNLYNTNAIPLGGGFP